MASQPLVSSPPGNPRCPRCETEIHPETFDDPLARFDVLKCPSCGGRFFPAAELRRIEDLVVPRLLEIRQIPRGSDQAVPLRCPVCVDEVMTKLEHERDRKVIVDVCPVCEGTWLDDGELEAIQREGLVVFLVNNVRWFASLFRE